MKTILKLKIFPEKGKPFIQEIEIEKEKFFAIREFNEDIKPDLLIANKEVLVLNIKEEKNG